MNKMVEKTPYYLIRKEIFDKNCMLIEEAFKKRWDDNVIFGYSVKTNHSPDLIGIAQNRGWIAETVSYDEMQLAYECGFTNKQIICNGPTKGKQMICEAIKQCYILNLDNLQEVEQLCEIIKLNGVQKNALIGLRVNFDLNADRGWKATDKKFSRFGICYENGDLKRAVYLLKENDISVDGLHMHTSTKTRSLNVFKELAKYACEISEKYNMDLKYVDMGGGFFGGQVVQGKPTMNEYADVISQELSKTFTPSHTALVLEPGVSVIATAVDYVTKVSNIRDIRGERIVTLDGTVLHINPFMADRNQSFDVYNRSDNIISKQHICGCTCMETDYFASIIDDKELTLDSKLIFHNAGAYTMAFNSDFIIKPPKVYVEDDIYEERVSYGK